MHMDKVGFVIVISVCEWWEFKLGGNIAKYQYVCLYHISKYSFKK